MSKTNAGLPTSAPSRGWLVVIALVLTGQVGCGDALAAGSGSGPGHPREQGQVPAAEHGPNRSGLPLSKGDAECQIPTRVLVTDVRLRGPLPEAAALRTLMRHRHRLKRCYDEALRRDPKLHGELLFRLTIDAPGRTSQVALVRDGLGDAKVGQCMSEALNQIRFEAATAKSEVHLVVAVSTPR